MKFEEQLQFGMDHLSAHDPVMKQLVEVFGLPTFRPHQQYYQELVESIVSQQLSVKAAATILGRFVELFGHFPLPEEILACDIERLRAAGLSRPKASYIQDLAMRVSNGSVSFESLDSMTNQQIIENLTAIKGIGVWTVHMFLIFAMGRLDVLAVGDLGVRNALTLLYTKEYNFVHVVKDVDIQKLSDHNQWHPYESLACWYAWQSLKNTPGVAA